jgi:hypothetical protein
MVNLSKNMPRVLWYTKSMPITEEDLEGAAKLSSNVGFRNGSLNPGDRPEPADAVAGHVPEALAKLAPVVKTRKDLDAVMAIRRAGGDPMAVGNDEDEDDDTPTIEYLMGDDGNPVLDAEQNMLVVGSPEAAAYLQQQFDTFLEEQSDDYKIGYAEGLTKTEYKPEEVTDDYKNGYLKALERAREAEQAAEAPPVVTEKVVKNPGTKKAKAKAAKAGVSTRKGNPNSPKKPAAVPGWGKNP